MESDQAAHTDFDKLPTKVSLGGEVINLDIFTKAVIFAESLHYNTYYVFTISLKCVHTYIYCNEIHHKIMYLQKLSSSLKYWTPRSIYHLV